jgi:hypothetical protein
MGRTRSNSVLVWIYRDGEIQNGSNGKDHDACRWPTNHLTPSLRDALSLVLIDCSSA